MLHNSKARRCRASWTMYRRSAPKSTAMSATTSSTCECARIWLASLASGSSAFKAAQEFTVEEGAYEDDSFEWIGAIKAFASAILTAPSDKPAGAEEDSPPFQRW